MHVSRGAPLSVSGMMARSSLSTLSAVSSTPLVKDAGLARDTACSALNAATHFIVLRCFARYRISACPVDALEFRLYTFRVDAPETTDEISVGSSLPALATVSRYTQEASKLVGTRRGVRRCKQRNTISQWRCSACQALEFRLRMHLTHTPELPRRSPVGNLLPALAAVLFTLPEKDAIGCGRHGLRHCTLFSDMSVLRAVRPGFGFARVSLTRLSSGFTRSTLEHRCLSAPVGGLTSCAYRCVPTRSGRVKAGYMCVANAATHSRCALMPTYHSHASASRVPYSHALTARRSVGRRLTSCACRCFPIRSGTTAKGWRATRRAPPHMSTQPPSAPSSL